MTVRLDSSLTRLDFTKEKYVVLCLSEAVESNLVKLGSFPLWWVFSTFIEAPIKITFEDKTLLSCKISAQLRFQWSMFESWVTRTSSAQQIWRKLVLFGISKGYDDAWVWLHRWKMDCLKLYVLTKEASTKLVPTEHWIIFVSCSRTGQLSAQFAKI